MVDYARMNQYLYEGNAKEVEQRTKDALAEGRPVQEVLTHGLIAGMSVVGEDFKHNVLYVPEVLIAARAMKAGMAVLRPLLSAQSNTIKPAGVLLMGTVRGDLHDIGKNLVSMMAEGAGFEVHDIGVDQSVEKFRAAADKCKPTIIGMSALLTTTMTYMKTVIDGRREAASGAAPEPRARLATLGLRRGLLLRSGQPRAQVGPGPRYHPLRAGAAGKPRDTGTSACVCRWGAMTKRFADA